MVYACFCAGVVGLSRCSDSMMYKAENMSCLALHRKCLLIPASSHGQQELELKQWQINRKHLVFRGWMAIYILSQLGHF